MNVSAERGANTYRTTVDPNVSLQKLTIGYAIPSDERVESVTLNGAPVDYSVRKTNRGLEVLVKAVTTGEQNLVVRIQ